MATLRRISFFSSLIAAILWLCLSPPAREVSAIDQDHMSSQARMQTHELRAVSPADPVAALGELGDDTRVIDTLRGSQFYRAAIPPRDPILTVAAPADARAVTAYFPFGLVERMSHDDERDRWYVRFLVPREVQDGLYTISVGIVDARGELSWKEIGYTLDGTEPALRIELDEVAWAGEFLHVAVDPLSPVRELYLSLPGVTKTRIALARNVESGLYEGRIRVPFLLPSDQLKVRVVARDRARNRVQEEVFLPVLFDGC